MSDVLQEKASPWRDPAVEYLLESTKDWSDKGRQQGIREERKKKDGISKLKYYLCLSKQEVHALKDTASQFSRISWVRDRVVAKHLQGTRWAGGWSPVTLYRRKFQDSAHQGSPIAFSPLGQLGVASRHPSSGWEQPPRVQPGLHLPCRLLPLVLVQVGGGEVWGLTTGANALFCFTAETMLAGEKEKIPEELLQLEGRLVEEAIVGLDGTTRGEKRAPPKRHSLVLNNNRPQKQENSRSLMLLIFLRLNCLKSKCVTWEVQSLNTDILKTLSYCIVQ